MIVVGLTGGIGSGKTTVANSFKELGIPVYTADDEAKKLMNTSDEIKQKIVNLFGEEAYRGGELNRSFVADKIFNDKNLLGKMNAIVHPVVRKHFDDWVLKQSAPYVIKEVAILFEHGGDKLCDYVITVIAPQEERIRRVIARDNTSESKVKAIMDNQWSDHEKIKHSHFVIENLNLDNMRNQVQVVHNQILKNL
ncbi:dephospho-CoA kinase [Mangrovimonas aestuarii]|uniref:dephospho-CoA kinase n=1 Tax=Mangrovimonas aestuarii TaxID=3018443 RepID=UPI002377D612|nr:dephospho-CoA kinase [Mangrovimonas aestuarii]